MESKMSKFNKYLNENDDQKNDGDDSDHAQMDEKNSPDHLAESSDQIEVYETPVENQAHKKSSKPNVKNMSKSSMTSQITLFAAIAAALFTCVGLFTDNGLSTSHFDTSTQSLWKAQKAKFAVMESETSDALTQLNDKINQLDNTQTSIKEAMKALNDNVQTLNKNLRQVQENMLTQMKSMGAPDLSKIESAINDLKKDDRGEPVNDDSKEKTQKHINSDKGYQNSDLRDQDRQQAKAKTKSVQDNKIQSRGTTNSKNNKLIYLGNTPNGAVVEFNGAYLTLSVGQKTPLGIVKLISNKQLIIGDQSYLYQQDKSIESQQ